MAVGKGAHEPVTSFEDWYTDYREDPRTGKLDFRGLADCAGALRTKFNDFEREHRGRVANYHKYETMADAEVVSSKPDLPNVSDGTIAGMVRRTARSVVQHTPNVQIVCEFAEDSPKGILAKHILRTLIIGDELNSNEMQQNLFASVMTSYTLGFDAVVPVLMQRGDGVWKMEYDSIHYQDVFPEPGVKDVRKAPEVFVRRYLTKGEVAHLIRTNANGWDISALRRLLDTAAVPRQPQSVDRQSSKHGSAPSGYEIITWYSSSGDPFLTFEAREGYLLRIEKNVDPMKRHPVRFLVLEKDPLQPLGKSQIALVFGRQEFGDLMLNGAMKLWYRNLNPTIVGYGTGINGAPNMSPGKYVDIQNPNARLEPFEVNTQTLLQYGAIAQQNQGAMINLTGAADQQMAANSGHGMSATPQGVEAQESMVDITTNNYQKAVEYFFSQYCSYALTVFFQEMRGAKKMLPSAETRQALIDAGMPEELFNSDGELQIEMSEMATVYHVKCVEGSLTELEQEKQLRVLNEMFIPLSQAMPALAAAQDPEMLRHAAQTMRFIIDKQIQLSGSNHADDISKVLHQGFTGDLEQHNERVGQLESSIGSVMETMEESNSSIAAVVAQLQEQVSLLAETQQVLMETLGVSSPTNAPVEEASGSASASPVAV